MHALCQRWLLPALLVLAALVLAACGSDEDPIAAGSAPAGDEESASFNDADISFIQGMIPHHQQATEMAALVAERSEREELRSFADKIIADQSAEIEEMQGLLAAAGAEEGAGHGGTGGMSGSSQEPDMAELQGLSGQEFDLAFLDMMSAHHKSAIEMAEQVLDEGGNRRVADLANRIMETQRAEIEQMAVWRGDWAA
jgi:uncharacterized protein (DUF305 family)